jgi:hypothetical protein
LQLSSFAQVDLGLSKDEFYDLTPREFDALCRRRERLRSEGEYMLAQLTAYVINFSHWRSQPKEPVSSKNFMLHPFRSEQEEAPSAPKRLNRKKIEAKVRSTLGLLWG